MKRFVFVLMAMGLATGAFTQTIIATCNRNMLL